MARLLIEIFLNRFLHRRNTGRPADQNDLVNIRRRKPRVLHRLARRLHRRFHQIPRQLVELRPRQRQIEMQGAARPRRDERQIDARRRHAGKLDFRLLRRFDETLFAHFVSGKVNPVVLLKLRNHPVHDPGVKIIAAEVRVAVRRLDLENAVAQLQNRHVEGAAAKVKDKNRLVAVLIETVGQRRRRRLVDNTQDVKPGDLAGVLRRLPLTVVKIGRHRNDRLRYRFAKVRLRIRLELLQDHRRDFRRRVALAVNLHFVITFAHVPLDRADRTGRIRHRLSLRQLSDKALPILRETHHRRRQAAALRVRDNGRLAAFHDRYDGIRRP